MKMSHNLTLLLMICTCACSDKSKPQISQKSAEDKVGEEIQRSKKIREVTQEDSDQFFKELEHRGGPNVYELEPIEALFSNVRFESKVVFTVNKLSGSAFVYDDVKQFLKDTLAAMLTKDSSLKSEEVEVESSYTGEGDTGLLSLNVRANHKHVAKRIAEDLANLFIELKGKESAEQRGKIREKYNKFISEQEKKVEENRRRLKALSDRLNVPYEEK